MLALVSDWIKRFGNSSSAFTKTCQNRHLFRRMTVGENAQIAFPNLVYSAGFDR